MKRGDPSGAGQDTPDSAFTPPLVAGERAQIATLYQAGQSFWRVGVPHFCPWDGNWAKGLPEGAIAPTVPAGNPNNPVVRPCIENGSIIECENQILGEQFPVAGTGFGLRYQGDRSVGGQQGKLQIAIPITGATPLPSVVSGIETIVQTQGRQWTYHSDSLAPNQFVTWTWDRTDAWGRTVSGHADLEVQVGYQYQASSTYQSTAKFGDFGGSVLVTGNRSTSQLVVWEPYTISARSPRRGHDVWSRRAESHGAEPVRSIRADLLRRGRLAHDGGREPLHDDHDLCRRGLSRSRAHLDQRAGDEHGHRSPAHGDGS